MTTQAHAEIHVDHEHWRNDIKMWKDDIEAWKQQQARLLSEIEIALGTTAAELNDHRNAIGEHEKRVVRHERSIAECERSETPQPKNVATALMENPDHDEEATRHIELCKLHGRMKSQHLSAMARLNVALKTLRRGLNLR
jgi:hypothetical protein